MRTNALLHAFICVAVVWGTENSVDPLWSEVVVAAGADSPPPAVNIVELSI